LIAGGASGAAEPAAWALTLMGLDLLGGGLRSGRKAHSSALPA